MFRSPLQVCPNFLKAPLIHLFLKAGIKEQSVSFPFATGVPGKLLRTWLVCEGRTNCSLPPSSSLFTPGKYTLQTQCTAALRESVGIEVGRPIAIRHRVTNPECGPVLQIQNECYEQKRLQCWGIDNSRCRGAANHIDVTPAEFGVYVNALYRSYFIKDYMYRLTSPSGAKLSDTSECQVLQLWRLSGLLRNKRTLMIAEESFNISMEAYSIPRWEQTYQDPKHTGDSLQKLVARLEKLYDYCVEHDLPRQDAVVTATSNMLMQLLARHLNRVRHDLHSMAILKLMKRLENPRLERPAEQVSDQDPPTASATRKRSQAAASVSWSYRRKRRIIDILRYN